jgi:hypothetical protein
MDIVAAFEQVGTYRGAAALCVTTQDRQARRRGGAGRGAAGSASEADRSALHRRGALQIPYGGP